MATNKDDPVENTGTKTRTEEVEALLEAPHDIDRKTASLRNVKGDSSHSLDDASINSEHPPKKSRRRRRSRLKKSHEGSSLEKGRQAERCKENYLLTTGNFTENRSQNGSVKGPDNRNGGKFSGTDFVRHNGDLSGSREKKHRNTHKSGHRRPYLKHSASISCIHAEVQEFVGNRESSRGMEILDQTKQVDKLDDKNAVVSDVGSPRMDVIPKRPYIVYSRKEMIARRQYYAAKNTGNTMKRAASTSDVRDTGRELEPIRHQHFGKKTEEFKDFESRRKTSNANQPYGCYQSDARKRDSSYTKRKNIPQKMDISESDATVKNDHKTAKYNKRTEGKGRELETARESNGCEDKDVERTNTERNGNDLHFISSAHVKYDRKNSVATPDKPNSTDLNSSKFSNNGNNNQEKNEKARESFTNGNGHVKKRQTVSKFCDEPKYTNARGRQSDVNGRSKKTFLFIVIDEIVSEQSRVKEYLKHRMGDSSLLEFTIETIKKLPKGNQTGFCLIVLGLSSYRKAQNARYKLHQSNINTTDKIRCYMSENEAMGSVLEAKPDYECEKREQLKKLIEVVRENIDRHEDKIVEMNALLEQIGYALSSKRGIPFHLFEMYTNEKIAREEKLDELQRQRKEFLLYVQSMRQKIEESDCNSNLEKDMKEIRKNFGVECHRLQAALPMYSRRSEILTTIKNNQVSVILGETGSGKSTQMVQYLYQAGLANKGRVVCTQPRKIAAMSLATHVAKELASSVGQVVGYQVGMHSKKTAITRILFTTDHSLLNECLRDKDLSEYACIIIDEAHERNINTDLLLGMLKECLQRRPELRVVITSATIDPDVFVSYFGGPEKCPVLKVSGRTYPVEVFWEANSGFDASFPEDYERKALNKAIEVHTSCPVDQGDIIVFLTSAIEAERCCERFKKRMTGTDHICLPLHGKLRPDEQKQIFEATGKGKRKIVFATNSAETSITIPGIKYVIDTGVVKEMRYDPKKNMNSLDVVSVSQSSANQRKGRAGRTAPGICFRLYTETDFHCMAKSSSPEILRIHLGQGILKLMELGVDPFVFDFVQSPARSAMNAALTTLQEIEAIHEHRITDLGKWLAQLPLEPRLGVLVKNGIDIDVPIETLVIAASSSKNSIYFRAGTEEQKKKADLKKMPFCHTGGDYLTILNVFREWDAVPEKAKGKWCVQNSINGKVMKSIRENVNEILSVLRKEMNLSIKHEFRKPEDVDELLQKLIFENMKSNISFYLGHEDAGYLTAEHFSRAQVHPSSSLLSLGQQPTWVVYSQLLKTSDDFMTNVTPVPEEYIDTAIRNNRINIDKMEMEARKVHKAVDVPVGRHVFWKFVGPKHANRREIENNIKTACADTTVIVEADKARGKLALYCVPEFDNKAISLLKDALTPLPEQLLFERREDEIGSGSGVRALIGVGAEAIEMLMPNQYRAVNVKESQFSKCELSECNVRDIVLPYGDVEQIWRPAENKRQSSLYWGKVTFVDEMSACDAVERINEDENIEFSLVPITYKSQIGRKPDFTMKIKWCRRPCKGMCFVDLSRPEDMAALLLEPVDVDGREIQVLKARNQSDLLLRGLPSDVTEYSIIEGLCSALGIPVLGNYNRFSVTIVRTFVSVASNEMERVKTLLKNKLSVFVPESDFKLHVREYRQQTVICIAFVRFDDPDVCEATVADVTDEGMTIDGNKVEVEMELKSTVFIQKRLFEIIKGHISGYIERKRQRGSSSLIELRTLKNGNVAVDINAVSPRKLAAVKVDIDKIVDGDELHCGISKDIHVLFTFDCRNKIQEIEKATGTLIAVDQRMLKVTVQGCPDGRQNALTRIEKYVKEFTSAVEREICLKGDTNPPGMMKAFVMNYGIDLVKFREQTGVLTSRLNIRKHVLTVTGTEDAVKRASDVTELLKSTISVKEIEPSDEELEDCPVCLCPVELTELSRLELCGHAYCKDCLKTQVQTSVHAKEFPIMCAKEGCEMPLVVRDINSQIKQGNLSKAKLVESAVSCFVARNNSEYKYCITADCPMVYRISSDGAPFQCSLCLTTICTACHLKYHDGMTCGMYRSAKDENNTLKAWLKEKPNKRKLCPKCSVGIEKIEGCDHMTCKCGAHICWKCMKYFDSGRECYGHLESAHGSFV